MAPHLGVTPYASSALSEPKMSSFSSLFISSGQLLSPSFSLGALFSWLDQTPIFYWSVGLAAFAIFAGWVVAGVGRLGDRRLKWEGILSSLVILAVLLAWRWPFLFSATEYNPDESQILAGSITLTHDPVFWRAVDGTTSGPLNFYALLPIHWLGAPIDYFTARLMGLILVWVALLCGYNLLKRSYGVPVARLGIIPAVVFFALVHEWDFIHYSSEHVSLSLFTVAAWLLWDRAGVGGWKFCLGGFVAGLMPWAKLQAGPLGFALILMGCWRCCSTAGSGRKLRRLLPFLFSAGLPSLLFIVVIYGTGQTGTFFKNYFAQNIQYIGGGESLIADLADLRDRAAETYLLPLFLLTEIISVVVGGIWMVRRRKAPDLAWVAGGFFSFLAILSVLVPGRGFLHYTLFMIMPLTLWGGSSMGCLLAGPPNSGRRMSCLALLGCVGGLLPLGFRLQQPKPDMIGKLAYDWRYPRTPLGNILKRGALPGDRLAIWGWYPRLHVESGLPQGTRDGYTYWSIEPSAVRDYHRSAFLQDLEKNEPAFFVDAVGPQSYYFTDRSTESHETVPALRDYMEKNYALLIDFGYSRFYVRRDQVGRSALSISALQRDVEAGRSDDSLVVLQEQDPEPNALPRKMIGGKNAIMMLPPGQLMWRLDGNEKEFVFEYGYDPVAYQDITQGNGTEISLFIDQPGGSSKELFRRVIDPAHVATDRGRQISRVKLPDLPHGASLVLKTGPGAYGDNSWDWAYFARARFRRYPQYVSPALNDHRLP